MQVLKTLPTSINEIKKRRIEAPCLPFTNRNKREKSVRTRRVGSSPCLADVSGRKSYQELVWCLQVCKQTGENEHEAFERAWWTCECQDQTLYDLRSRPHALLWLSNVYGILDGMYACKVCYVILAEYLQEG
eukprot:763091-Pelagomonas_calceolata.AAC.5